MTIVKCCSTDKDRFTDREVFFPSVFPGLFNDYGRVVPAVNISETKNEFTVELAAPGIGKDLFRIGVEDGILSISAEVENKTGEDREGYSRREFSSGSFRRTFRLPDTVDSEKISASCENGILSVRLPRKEEAKEKAAREIRVQ